MIPLPTLAILLSFVTIAFASPTDYGGRKCGNHPSPEHINEKESKFADALSRLGVSTRTANNFSNHTISVYFNVISSGTQYAQGYIPYVMSLGPFLPPLEGLFLVLIPSCSRDQQIKDQIDVLNTDYKPTGLQFQLVNVTRVENPKWFNDAGPETPEQTEMKTALRRGGPDALNLYSVSFNNSAAEGLLGYATFPSNYTMSPKDDGVVINFATLPGGVATPYNLGRTLTHEVGHWVGLYHTFQDGCDGDGDYVDDTPAEAEAARGCPIGRDSCSAPGLDREFDSSTVRNDLVAYSRLAVQNYMDYSDDSCLDNFTPGQIVRLRQQIYAYRNIAL